MRKSVLSKTARNAYALFAVVVSIVIFNGASASAEGTSQINEMQSLTTSPALYADILTAGETINISSCENLTINIWNTNGTPSVNGDDTQVVTNTAFSANLACNAALPNPITTAYKYTPASTGTYRIQLNNTTIARYDFSVTANAGTNPDPTVPSGRIWAYTWRFSTGSFAASAATDANFYVLVPAPDPSQNFVWKLDLNKFSGNAYELNANSLGLNSPYSGLSASQSDSSVSPEFPIYIGYPLKAGPASTTTPSISVASFKDDANEDNIFSPNATPGVQDTGNFTFTSNAANANYAITIDTNQNGVYGAGDRLLLGKAVQGINTVAWDGNYPDGSPVNPGVYTAQIQLRTGEYHFIAGDVETSGGTTDGGTTWTNGLTIYRALDANTTQNTTVYWDDSTELSGEANVPNGVTSGSTADTDNNGRADGFHTWGDFSGSGIGNVNNIDTYVYGPSDTEIVNIAVSSSEAADNDNVSAAIETGAPNNGDGNGDGTVDFLQNLVTSLPNPTSSNKYNTIASSGCSNLSNVAIYAENQLSNTDSRYDYPVGLFNFRVNCLAPGASTNITIYYDNLYDTTTWTPRKFINGQYSNISGATFSTATVGGKTVTTLTYSVTDGGPLDEDGTANGVIVDPVGPGINNGTAAASVGVPNTGLQQQSAHLALTFLTLGLLLVPAALIYGTKHATLGRPQ